MADVSDCSSYLPLLAVGLDLVLGDPRWLPHPVRLIGNMADGLEALARSSSESAPGKLVGMIAAMVLVCIVSALVYALTTMVSFQFLIALYLCSAGLALRCLLSEASNVHRMLQHGQLTEAKVALSMLVSRDTSAMNAQDIRRSLAETLSENLNDGFTAPLFWLCITGPVGMWAYKTISTLDSMWGYKTERYSSFGWFAARADDVLGYVPARLTALAMLFVGLFMHLNVRETLKRFMKDARQMDSPNAGWPMAAAAWLMGAQMGGLTSYHGKMKYKPLLGARGTLWTANRFYKLRLLSFWSAMLLVLVGQIAIFFLPGFFQ